VQLSNVNHALAGRLCLRRVREEAVQGILRLQDDPLARSLAWQGASPLLHTGSTYEQLSLFAAAFHAPAGDSRYDRTLQFNPAGFRVEHIHGAGKNQKLDGILRRYHYEGSRGMNGTAFGLYYGKDELVGVCCFGRIANPAWARITFQPTTSDLERVRLGLMNDYGLSARLVAESEYLELNRLALVDQQDTDAPLQRGAASYFMARCLLWFEERNRALFQAVQLAEQGRRLGREQLALLDHARLDRRDKGLGFIKSVVSFADPWEGHQGFVYQVLGFHHAGRSTPDGRWEPCATGMRSGQRIGRRTLQKANKAEDAGHDTAVLRLVWEGGEGLLRVFGSGGMVQERDLASFRSVEPRGCDLDGAIRTRWTTLVRELRARHGEAVRIETRYLGGGVEKRLYPAKHRYVRMLGARYWQHEVERRCVYLAGRMAERDAEWARRAWGALPDTRRHFYPRAADPVEVKPALRGGAETLL
jgi:hypothetical protein